MNKNSIELNGNVYDVRTGKLLSSATVNQTSGRSQSQQSGMDIRKPKQTNRSPGGVKHTKSVKKSQTLMRGVVSKPTFEAPNTDNQTLSSKKKRVDFSRIERAAKAVKSSAVQKFHPEVFSASEKAPQHPARPANEKKSESSKQSPQEASNSSTGQTAKQSFTDSALEKANSHEQTYEEDHRLFSRLLDRVKHLPNSVKYSAMAVLAVVGLGVAGYLVAPRISVQLASNRSGVAVSMPSYRPAGFQLDRTVEYEPGEMTLHYNSLTDGRNFRITKSSTDWNSEALRNNFVENKDLYQTVSSKGKTIYIYNGSNATWIDGGVWYTVEGASALNSDQLLRLADSL